MVFDKSWFDINQSKLLFLLNSPVTRTPMRHLLRIDGKSSSVGKYEITKIDRNSIIWQPEPETFVQEFRTHNKFKKRLYYGLYPLWKTMHTWDSVVNFLRFEYAGLDLNLGFDTFTGYPDPDPETTTVDGHTRRSSVDQTFANIRSGAGVAQSSTAASENILQLTCSATTNQFSVMRRYIWLVDTSSIASGATISSETFSVYGSAKANTIGEPDLDIVGSNPASNTTLANGDYSVLDTTVYGSLAYASWSTSGYSDITLTNATVKAGITKFGGRNSWDTDNSFTGTWSSGVATSYTAYSADQAGTSNDPKYVVVYTPEASARRRSMQGAV